MSVYEIVSFPTFCDTTSDPKVPEPLLTRPLNNPVRKP